MPLARMAAKIVQLQALALSATISSTLPQLPAQHVLLDAKIADPLNALYAKTNFLPV